MKKQKKNLLAISNISIAILFLIILLLSKLSDNVIYLMMMTLMVGWAIPYFVLLITGIAMFKNNHPKLSLVFNLCCILLNIVLIIFCIKLYDKYFLVLIIEYGVMMLWSILNFIYYFMYIKKHPNLENEKIKKEKKENNGAIV